MFTDKNSKVIISVILGLGIATLFRKACEGRNCIIIKGPARDVVENNTYRYKGKCYKYTSENTSCN